MTTDHVSSALQRVLDGWPQTDAWSPSRIALYAEALNRYTDEEAVRGVNDYIKQGERFPPSVGDLTKCCDRYAQRRRDGEQQRKVDEYVKRLRGEQQ